MKFCRLNKIATRNRKYSIGDIAVPASLFLFTLAGLTLFWSF